MFLYLVLFMLELISFFFILAICKIFCFFFFQATLKIEKIDFLSSSICIFLLPSLICKNLFGYNNITCNIFSFSSLCFLLFLVDFIHYCVTRCYGYIVVFFINNFAFVLVCATFRKNYVPSFGPTMVQLGL